MQGQDSGAGGAQAGKSWRPPAAEARAAWDRLRAVLQPLEPLAVAYSGGLDSRFLCHAAQCMGLEVLALHATGPHIPPAESALAEHYAALSRLPLVLTRLDPLSLPAVANNSRERCYACKTALIAHLRAVLRQGYGKRYHLCDGSQADDMQAFRPGMRALQEAGVASPLALAGIGKAQIRILAEASHMPDAAQQARPCLLTRLAYGLHPTAPQLRAVAQAEDRVAAWLAAQPLAVDFRLRLLPRPLLQLAKVPAAWRETCEAALPPLLAEAGFAGGTLCFSEKVSGFFDEKQENPVAAGFGTGLPL